MRPAVTISAAALMASDELKHGSKFETVGTKSTVPKRAPQRGILAHPRARDSVPPAAVKRARRWLANHKPGDTPPGHIADTLAACNMSYGR